jgi:heat shock protein HslJ
MRKLMVSLLIAMSIIGCAGNAKAGDGKPQGSDAVDFKDKEWKLVEVWLDGKMTNYNRKDLEAQKISEFFNLKFDAENFSGVAAPNRYSAPYTVDGKKIKAMPARATLMAAIWQPENLKEHDYFLYLQNISEWTINGGKLELTSKTEDGRAVKLVFAQ